MIGTSFMTALAIAFGMEITAEIVVETWWKEQDPKPTIAEAEYLSPATTDIPTLEMARDALQVNQPSCQMDAPLKAMETCGGVAHVRVYH